MNEDPAIALPHESVFVRLGPSRIAGIGVHAIRPIPAGTNLFADDRIELVWVEAATLDDARLSEEQRRLYEDFAIRRGSRLGCPISFNNLTTGWYLNEPPDGESPNVSVDRELNFRAARDIGEGEELTVRYAEFSEAPGER